jgi:hypothetical protein
VDGRIISVILHIVCFYIKVDVAVNILQHQVPALCSLFPRSVVIIGHYFKLMLTLDILTASKSFTFIMIKPRGYTGCFTERDDCVHLTKRTHKLFRDLVGINQ